MKGSPTAYWGGQFASHANGCGAERKNLHANLLNFLPYWTSLEKMFHSPVNKDTHIGFQSVTKQKFLTAADLKAHCWLRNTV